MIGCLCLTFAFLGLFVIYGMWQSARQPTRVEAAVRASFPDFCVQPSQQLRVEKEQFQFPWQYNRWNVYCEPSPLPWRDAAMTVDVVTCVAEAPQVASFEWSQTYGSLLVSGQKLAVCP